MREVQLHGIRAAGRVALVDDEDYELVSRYNWWAGNGQNGCTYAIGWVGGRNMPMHVFLTGNPITDHENRNGLDNQRGNLRQATIGQNNANRQGWGSSGFRGVYWRGSKSKPWRASIRKDGHLKHLGSFDSPVEAAVAYDEAASQLHGEFATLNFPSIERESVSV